MGILRDFEEAKPIKLEDSMQDYLLDEDEEDFLDESTIDDLNLDGGDQRNHSAPVTPAHQQRQNRRQNRRRQQNGTEKLMGDSYVAGGGRKTMGARKMRRIEHARLLNALVDDEICEDYSDMLPESVTAFSQLFYEKENMDAWNDFIGKSEEEQEKIIAGNGWVGNGWEKLDCDEGHRLGGQSANTKDLRQAHPAYAAEACYARIDSNLRQLLNHKQIPFGKVEHFEMELLTFFSSSDADGVWVERVDCSYDRLILHAVAQYLSLRSQSHDLNGIRQTQVENPKPFFVSPRETLVDYLERRRESHQIAVSRNRQTTV